MLLYIGLFIYNGLTQSKTPEVLDDGTHNTTKPPPPGAAPGGHWHGDEWHDTPHDTTPKIKRARTKTNTRQNLVLKNSGPPLPITCAILPHPTPLPTHLQARLNRIYQEMIIAGTRYEVVGGENVITVEAYEREYEVLVGDMLPEDAVVFLETHGIYNPLILDKKGKMRLSCLYLSCL